MISLVNCCLKEPYRVFFCPRDAPLSPWNTYVDILGQEVVGELVLLEEVAVGSATREEASKKESEKSN